MLHDRIWTLKERILQRCFGLSVSVKSASLESLQGWNYSSIMANETSCAV